MKFFGRNKKGIADQMVGLIMAIVLTGVLTGVGFLVLSEFSAQLTTGSAAQEGVNETITAMKTIPDFLPVIIISVLAAIIIGLLVAAFIMKR